MTLPNSASSRDSAFHLHPFTNAKQYLVEPAHIIARGDGIHVIDSDGKSFIEAVSGLWCAGLGFSEPRLVDAARLQMEKLPFYHSFNHRSHDMVIDLAEKLVSIAPVPMSKVFFSNSGSEANDTALKLIWYRSNALGRPGRKKVIARDRAYHGSTLAAASLTGLSSSRLSFDVDSERVLRTRCPHHWREALEEEDEQAFSTRLADDLEAMILHEGPETIAAFFAEPVQAAGGVIPPPAGYWPKIQTVLDRYDILLVADEVVCGFGRTGTMFGSSTYAMTPDIMVLSKQMAAGYLPLAALVVNERTFGPIADESDRLGTLGHGFTSSGHPVCCAVSLETIRIIEERGLVANAAAMGERLRQGLAQFADHPMLGEIRSVGLLAGLELITDKASKSSAFPIGTLGGGMTRELLERGVIVRALGDTIALCPPMTITETEIDDLVDRTGDALMAMPRAMTV